LNSTTALEEIAAGGIARESMIAAAGEAIGDAVAAQRVRAIKDFSDRELA
jgi:hypothetical protein